MRAERCSSASLFSDTLNFMRADLVATITEDVGLILNSPIQPGMISREHARLEFVLEHAHWKLVDMNSMNGCLYNGVRVKESKLSGKIPTTSLSTGHQDLLFVFHNIFLEFLAFCLRQGCRLLV